ncbi:hypothetical protein D9M68_397460 [compost metagenome]
MIALNGWTIVASHRPLVRIEVSKLHQRRPAATGGGLTEVFCRTNRVGQHDIAFQIETSKGEVGNRRADIGQSLQFAHRLRHVAGHALTARLHFGNPNLRLHISVSRSETVMNKRGGIVRNQDCSGVVEFAEPEVRPCGTQICRLAQRRNRDIGLFRYASGKTKLSY